MGKITNELLYTVLKAVQADLSMVKESIRRIDARMGAMESLMAGFHSILNWHSQDIDEHRARLEALEHPADTES